MTPKHASRERITLSEKPLSFDDIRKLKKELAETRAMLKRFYLGKQTKEDYHTIYEMFPEVDMK